MLATDPLDDQALVKTETIVSLFVKQARRRPEAVAISAAGKSVSYSVLNDQASRIACAFHAHGIIKGSIVAVE